MSNEVVYLRCEKAIETIKTYNLGEWDNILDIKRTLEVLLDQFRNSYNEKDVNAIKNILSKRIIDLRLTLEVLNSLPVDAWTVDQVFLELEIRKNSAMYNYLELKGDLK